MRSALPVSAAVLALLAAPVLPGCGGAKARDLDAWGSGRVDPGHYVDSPAVLLLEEVELTYTFDVGRFLPYAELRRHRRVQVLTEAGRQQFARVFVPMTARCTPRDIQARLVHPNGESDSLHADRTLDFFRFPPNDKAASLYQEPGARVFGVPGLKVGDVIDYQSISVIRDPRWVEPLIAGEGLYDLPIKETRLSVVEAPGYDVDFRVTVRGELSDAAPERVPAHIFDPNAGRNAELDATRFIWQFKDLPGTFPEPRGHSAQAMATQVHVQFRRFAPPAAPTKAYLGYSTWNDVASWYRDMVGAPDKSGAGLAPTAKDARSKKEKLKSVQRGCAQLQLVDADVNLGALKAHRPGEIISAKKGDAKDVATACLSAAHAAGLDAFPVLVARRGRRAQVPDLPTPAAFDHVIIGVPGAGQYDFFDPTGLGAPTGRALPSSQGADGILIRPDAVERVSIPLDKAEQNTREVTYRLALGADAMVEGSASFKLVGQDAAFVLATLRDLKGDERNKALADWLSGGDQKLKWVDVQVSGGDTDNDDPVRVLVTLEKAPLGGMPGTLAVRMSELLGKPYPFLWREGRITPVDLGYRLTERVTASITLPEGMGLKRRPPDLVEDGPMAKVEQRYVVADGALWLRRERVQKEAYVDRNAYGDLKAFYEKLWRNLETSAPVGPGGERGRDYGKDPF